MKTTQESFNKQLFNVLRQEIPSDLEILYISIIGSQGKNFAGAGDNLDVRVLIRNPEKKYILQSPTQLLKFETICEGEKIDCVVMDILKAYSAVLRTDPCILDTLRGIPVYGSSTTFIDQMKKTFEKAYSQKALAKVYQGFMFQSISQDLKERNREFRKQVSYKVLGNLIFSILQIRAVMAGRNMLESFDIERLLELGNEEKTLMETIVGKRRTNKAEETELTEEIKGLVQKTLDQAQEFMNSFPKKKDQGQKEEELRKEVDKICLGLIIQNVQG